MKPFYFYESDFSAYHCGEERGTNLFRESLEKKETAVKSFKKLGLNILLYGERNEYHSEYLVYTYDPDVALAFINELCPLNKKYKLVGIKDILKSKYRQLVLETIIFDDEDEEVPVQIIEAESVDYWWPLLKYPVLKEDKPSKWDKIISYYEFQNAVNAFGKIDND